MEDYPLKERVRRICNVVESGEVMRFHATPSIPCQTVAAHAWGVSILAGFIKTDPRPDFLMECQGHDMEELYTGDVPFTTKREVPGMKEFLEKAEDAYRATELFDHFRITQAEQCVLKIADMLEGLRYATLNERVVAGKQVVAERWFNALCTLFSDRDLCNILNDQELERSYTLFHKFAPEYLKAQLYSTFSAYKTFLQHKRP